MARSGDDLTKSSQLNACLRRFRVAADPGSGGRYGQLPHPDGLLPERHHGQLAEIAAGGVDAGILGCTTRLEEPGGLPHSNSRSRGCRRVAASVPAPRPGSNLRANRARRNAGQAAPEAASAAASFRLDRNHQRRSRAGVDSSGRANAVYRNRNGSRRPRRQPRGGPPGSYSPPDQESRRLDKFVVEVTGATNPDARAAWSTIIVCWCL